MWLCVVDKNKWCKCVAGLGVSDHTNVDRKQSQKALIPKLMQHNDKTMKQVKEGRENGK
jgi:hypothetical protein